MQNSTFLQLLEAAKGNRSITEYCTGAGISGVTYSRITHGTCNPSMMTLIKLTSEYAAPQNGVTLNALVEAATKEGRLEAVPARHTVAGREEEPVRISFQYAGMTALQRKFIAAKHSVQLLENNNLLIDGQNTVSVHFLYLRELSDEFLVYRNMMGRLVLQKPDYKRTDYVLTNSKDFYEYVSGQRFQNCYKGNLIIALVDWEEETDKESFVSEEEIVADYYK